jgi:tryptophanyl-tRNA synthetase
MSLGTQKRILSGIQPTGNLHLGNYLGAIKNWVAMQNQYECYYMLADLHAITVPQEADKLRQYVRETAAAFIASGIDPQKCAIFPQSAVKEHSELAWILGCHTPIGWLNRMTQFKEKAGKDRENAVLGLYDYPVLMAADILVYKATHVPVGADQKQHVELARDIAGAFNRAYGQECFPLPEPVILGQATRVMSLRDGTKKMSKSEESDYSRINLTDDADTIALKFKKAKSDMEPTITYDAEKRPEVANLLNIYAALKDITREQALAECEGKNFSGFKQMLTELAVEKLSPITKKMRELLSDTDHIDQLLAKGVHKGRKLAGVTMKEVNGLAGFLEF